MALDTLFLFPFLGFFVRICRLFVSLLTHVLASFDLESVMLQARPEKADRKAAVCQDETQLNTVGDSRRAAPTKTLTFLSRDWWSCF